MDIFFFYLCVACTFGTQWRGGVARSLSPGSVVVGGGAGSCVGNDKLCSRVVLPLAIPSFNSVLGMYVEKKEVEL